MSNHQHEPVEIDPAALAESRMVWNGFTKIATFAIVISAVILLLMAFFLL